MITVLRPERITSVVPKRYPPEFRRKVLDLVEAGRRVAQIATDLDISEQTIYVWRRQHLIDTGQLPGTTSAENAELIAARRRIAELETEVAIHRRAAELLGEVVPPKRRYEAIAVMASEKLSVQLACRVLEVAESGFYEWRSRPLSPRALRHAWLTEQIHAVHQASFGTYGSRRVHAELRLGLGITVGHGAVEMLMRRAGIVGLPGRKRRRPVHDTALADTWSTATSTAADPTSSGSPTSSATRALLNRVEVRDLRRRVVAAAR